MILELKRIETLTKLASGQVNWSKNERDSSGVSQ